MAFSGTGETVSTIRALGFFDRMKASDDTSFFAGGIALMAAIVYFLLGRFPGSVWRTASIDIAASPERVFDHIKERTDNLTNPTLVRAERVPGPAETYLYHMRDMADCGVCGYPKNPDTVGQTILAEVIEKIDNQLSHVRTTEVRGVADTNARMMRFIASESCHTERQT